jgi:acetate kinase
MKAGGETPAHSILVVNAGSSSIKFALYEAGEPLARILDGKIERIGEPRARFIVRDPRRNEKREREIRVADHGSAAAVLLDALDRHMSEVAAVGHRVVHGMQHIEPERVTPRLIDHLRSIAACDPDHLPREIELMEMLRERHPQLAQVACFDTAFHRTLPRVARLLPIPRRYEAMGIVRYGFHGLSYASLVEELARRAGEKSARGRVILAHLGSGASLAAVREGRSIDTSMGFTPTGGIPMATRPGDFDPGVASYLLRTGELTPEAFNDMINRESGLIGISQTRADMRDLLARESSDVRAAEAVALFCYQARKWIGAFAAALEGLDTLVFSGGIGENAPAVRMRVCEGLGFLGIEVDAMRNDANADVISSATSGVTVRVIATDEETMIARTVSLFLDR